MKEDYLWDKTGADPAIEKLENALSVFRFDESSLQMPVSVRVPVEKPRYFKFLSFGFAAAAACAGVAVISWALLAPVSDPDMGPAVEQAFTQQPNTSAPEIPGTLDRPDVSVTAPVKAPVRTRTAGPNTKAVKKAVRQSGLTARVNRPGPEAAAFTKEEIYAYNQLVLALSITSDKLNLVKEKIPGE